MPANEENTVYPVSRCRMKDVPERQRPRELFERMGAEHVPDNVLVAIILRGGVRGVNVIDLADQLLQKYGSLTELAKAPVSELSELKGVGKVKAQVLKASLQLGRRLVEECAPARQHIRTPADAAGVLREAARTEEKELFWVLLLDAKNALKPPARLLTSGILDASLVHPREVFKEAIRESSAAVVLVHNHPSGDPTPSAEDIKVTRQLVQAGTVVDINVLDHVILGRSDGSGRDDFFSIREAGLVDFSS